MKKYIVGGWVRDRLLTEFGRTKKSSDKDWVVTGATPEEMLRLGFVPVGNDFPVFLHPRTHEEYALARTERKSGHGYKGFVFFASPSVSLEEDLLRRDLTINAIAMTEDGEYIDPFHGIEDLSKRVLRHVSRAFEEDPLRVLRLARFRAKLPEFTVNPDTEKMLSRMVESGEVDALVPERVSAEITKALKEEKPSLFFRELISCGFIARIYPDWIQTDFSLNLIDRISERFSEEERFAASLSAVDEKKLPSLLAALKMPKRHNEFAELFVQSLGRDFSNAADGQALLKVYRQTDAIRRPERFERLVRLLKEAGRKIDDKKLIEGLKVLKKADFKTIASTVTDKRTVPAVIEAATVGLLNDFLKEFPDQH